MRLVLPQPLSRAPSCPVTGAPAGLALPAHASACPARLSPAQGAPAAAAPPPSRPRLLLLGGTTEAAGLARALAAEGRWDATLSLAGRTRAPAASPLRLRVGGFGGADGLAAHLRAAGIAVLVDATHPFAARIAANAVAAARAAGVPLLRLERPGWTADPADRWTLVPDLDAAARLLAAAPPQRVLLTTGRTLDPFGHAPRHHYVVRCIEPPPLLPPGAELVLARGPFTLEGELALLRTHRIDRLVSKQSGGTAVAAKLLAARLLELPVLMLARPPRPPAETVTDVAQALRWLSLR